MRFVGATLALLFGAKAALAIALFCPGYIATVPLSTKHVETHVLRPYAIVNFIKSIVFGATYDFIN
jgi:hypothetical protein